MQVSKLCDNQVIIEGIKKMFQDYGGNLERNRDYNYNFLLFNFYFNSLINLFEEQFYAFSSYILNR